MNMSENGNYKDKNPLNLTLVDVEQCTNSQSCHIYLDGDLWNTFLEEKKANPNSLADGFTSELSQPARSSPAAISSCRVGSWNNGEICVCSGSLRVTRSPPLTITILSYLRIIEDLLHPRKWRTRAPV